MNLIAEDIFNEKVKTVPFQLDEETLLEIKNMENQNLEGFIRHSIMNQLLDQNPSKEKLYDEIINEVERRVLLEVLNLVNNNRTQAASLLGLSRTAFYKKIIKHDLFLYPQARE
ncbi:MAG TPA: helix-turn-helix domain-containing protein [Thermodesulfobacteriota bacterium]|nr:helix-turn-helix domain-containing protein [Thermodesulfobacteriota bacterium]